jgi:hypothetical protein
MMNYPDAIITYAYGLNHVLYVSSDGVLIEVFHVPPVPYNCGNVSRDGGTVMLAHVNSLAMMGGVGTQLVTSRQSNHSGFLSLIFCVLDLLALHELSMCMIVCDCWVCM